MKPAVDWSLYLVTDKDLALGRPVEDIVSAALKGGVSIVQIREKDKSTRDFLAQAEKIHRLCRDYHVPLIVNDRIDVAMAIGAEGIHIGQSDMPYAVARQLVGPDVLIGLSVENMDHVSAAESWDVDYYGVSPIFSTPTKTDVYTEWGIQGLQNLRWKSQKPLIAIGGLNASNAAEIVRAGADGVAVVSAIMSAPDPEIAAHDLKNIIKTTKSTGRG